MSILLIISNNEWNLSENDSERLHPYIKKSVIYNITIDLITEFEVKMN